MSLGRIKTETEDIDREVDVARGKFESALLDLLNKDDVSESEAGSDSDQKEKGSHDIESGSGNMRINAILPTTASRPVRKRRRKDTEMRDGGFHHTFVMRMFDRSVDLAQFEESSPLYPICRAWMLNQPHNSDLSVKQEPGSPFQNEDFKDNDNDKIDDGDQMPKVTELPWPDPCQETELSHGFDPRIPPPFPTTSEKLNRVNEECHVAPALLLTQHLHRWRMIRNQWKAVGQAADARYHKSYTILKAMFERENERADILNSFDDRKIGERQE